MGLATAKLVGSEGYHVVISDVNEERLSFALTELKELGVSAETAVSDITDQKSVDGLVEQAKKAGQLVGVVHTAGVSPQMGDAQFIARINAVGTIHITEAFLHEASEGFSLVNVASIAGHMMPGLTTPKRLFRLALTDTAAFERKLARRVNFGPKKMRPGQAYSTSKSFVIWYSQKMAAAYGAKGARIVSVSPGTFDTAMGRLEEKSGAEKLIEFAALKRYGRPDEVAELLAFLGTGKAGYISGTDILIDGGTKAGLTLKGLLSLAFGKK